MRCEKKEGRRNMGRGSLKQRRWERGKYKEEDIHIVCRVCVCVRGGGGGGCCGEYLAPELCFLAVWRLWECFVEGFPFSASFIFGGSCWTVERPVEIYAHTHTAAWARSSKWTVNKTYINKRSNLTVAGFSYLYDTYNRIHLSLLKYKGQDRSILQGPTIGMTNARVFWVSWWTVFCLISPVKCYH